MVILVEKIFSCDANCDCYTHGSFGSRETKFMSIEDGRVVLLSRKFLLKKDCAPCT
jgi:hypothetical protein